MTPELQQALYDKYPRLFRQSSLPMNETCMCWSVECGSGWYSIIDDMCSKLEDSDVEFTQVKEKCGELRVYFDCAMDEDIDAIDAIVEAAEDLSAETCELCGKPGWIGLNRYNWLVTRCPECRKEGL